MSDDSWRARHRIVSGALFLSVPLLMVVGLVGPTSMAETLSLPVMVGLFGIAGQLLRGRDARTELTSFGLILSSFAGVELSGGQLHAHLYILSAVALVSLYQRWGPLLYTVGAVVVHHVVLGFVAPERVFNMGGMQHFSSGDVVLMVTAHAGAVLVEVVAILLFWHFSEQLRSRLAMTVAQLREREEELRHQATHDSLTGLANRAFFADEMMTRMTEGGSFAVLMLDLDDFKFVNDTFGHHAGDELLQTVGRRLESCMRGGDLAARLGGDEFTVLLRTTGEPEDVQVAADRILATVSAPVRLTDTVADTELRVRVSIGIAHTDGTCTDQDLMRRADSAMYSAKRQGKGQWVMHGSESAAV